MIIFLPNFPSECRSRYQRCMVVFGVLRYNKEVRETVEQVDQCDCYMYRKWLLHPAFVSSPRVELTLASTAALKTQMPSNKGGDTLVPFPPPSCVLTALSLNLRCRSQRVPSDAQRVLRLPAGRRHFGAGSAEGILNLVSHYLSTSVGTPAKPATTSFHDSHAGPFESSC